MKHIIEKSEAELEVLTIEYETMQKAEGLELGSADEHHFDESLTAAQRAWLRDFSKRWEGASLIWTKDGPVQKGHLQR